MHINFVQDLIDKMRGKNNYFIYENAKVLDYFNSREFQADEFYDWQHLNCRGDLPA